METKTTLGINDIRAAIAEYVSKQTGRRVLPQMVTLQYKPQRDQRDGPAEHIATVSHPSSDLRPTGMQDGR